MSDPYRAHAIALPTAFAGGDFDRIFAGGAAELFEGMEEGFGSVSTWAGLVTQRRSGRSVHYSLTNRGLASWLLKALRFLETRSRDAEELSRAVEDVRRVWGQGESDVRHALDSRNGAPGATALTTRDATTSFASPTDAE